MKEERVLLANSYKTMLQAYRHLLEPAFENPKRMAGGDPGLF